MARKMEALMTTVRIRASLVLVVLALVLSTPALHTQARVTSPKDEFGFNIGDDYFLATYTQLTAYWNKLARESDRMKLVEIGKTAEGRPQLMAIITSPANMKKLDRYQEIARRLALAEGLTDEQAHALAREGKAVVWIDGGLHATEVLGAHQLIEMVYQMVSRTDPETMRFLDDVILLCVHANPDGMELVSNWYMREPDPKKRSTGGIPRLYQKYVGHDNNRDFYMSAQPETTNMNRVLYHEWFPQVMYNHHQTGPAGTVMFAPPFRDPFNYNFDPLVPIGIDMVGAAMQTRFAVENKPGVTIRRGSSYSTWWNGGLRTMVYFHNMIGLLTETIGNPTPVTIPFLPNRVLPDSNLYMPIAPQEWHFRQSIDYSITANRAVLDVVSRHREQFLYDIYEMGRNSIERGSRDNWTPTPRRVEAIEQAIQKEQGAQGARGGGAGFGGRGRGGAPLKYYEALKNPNWRDPRGYIIPSDQPDFLTATKFVNALIKGGITIHRATAPFTVAGKSYPAGSYVVKTAQAFRPHVLDMFEPQDHPDDIPYPGGPPTPPYDNAGWTLAFQMGVVFDRILDGFDGPFEKIEGYAQAPAGTVTGAPAAAGYLLSHRENDSFLAVNRLLAGDEDVYWLPRPSGDDPATAGTFFIAAKPSTLPKLQQMAREIGLSFAATASTPAADAVKLKKLRIGLWDRYGGSMPSGWTRWIFEQFEFPFKVVYAKELDAGNLRSKFDVLVFVDGAIPARDGAEGGFGGFGGAPENVPPEYQDMLGSVTVSKTVPRLREFLEQGGTILTIGSSANLGYALGLPMKNQLVEEMDDGTERPLPREKYYVPGSVLRVSVDNTNPLAQGLDSQVDVFFDNSDVFRLDPDAGLKGVKPVAWFASRTPLRSGWAWGQQYLQDGVAVIDATVGKGKLYLFGPEMLFRSQPHGTYKFIFNGIYWGASAGAAGSMTSENAAK
jgi:hypothetical protein